MLQSSTSIFIKWSLLAVTFVSLLCNFEHVMGWGNAEHECAVKEWGASPSRL